MAKAESAEQSAVRSASVLALSVWVLLAASGCGRDPGLSPPNDTETVKVTIKVPDGLEAEVMQVMYRSTVCTFADRSASGEAYPRDGYQSTEIQPARHGQSDLYEAKLPIDGGGDCKWKLSNVTFGVRYADPARFGNDVTHGGGGGVIVIFDNNDSPRGPADIKVDGDVFLVEDYYPWLKERFLGGRRKKIGLAGNSDYYYLIFKALEARAVHYEPLFHSSFLVVSEGARLNKVGNYAVFRYPDGSVVTEARNYPDFKKLEDIRKRTQAE